MEPTMTDKKIKHRTDEFGTLSPGDDKRPYTAPRMLSAEPLEAVAAVCDPNTPGGPGKDVPFPCATLGS